MSFRDYQNIVQGVGGRVNSRKENLSQREFDIKDFLQQQGANKYRNAMQSAEDKYKNAEDVFSGDLSKYQDRLLKAIGLDEQQSQAVSALVNTAGAVGVPLVGGVKTKLKGIAQRKRDRVKQSQDERAKELKEGKAKSRGKTEPSERIPEERIPQRDTRALQEDLRGADEEFGGGDVNIPEAEPTPQSVQPRPTPEPEARGGGGDIEMQPRGVKQKVRSAGETSPSEGVEMENRTLQEELQGKEDARVAEEAQQVEARNAERQATFQAEETVFDKEAEDFARAGGKALGKAGAKAVAEEGAEGAVEATAEEGAELGLASALEGASALLGPAGIVAGLGLGIFDLGNAFHWWGGGKSEDIGPAPKAPTPPKLEDIPKPQQIQVGGPVMTSGRYHQNTAPASVINSSMLRR
jgi:hypothetical protein